MKVATLLQYLVYVEGERPHGNAHHALAVVEELDGLRVQREVVGVLVVEKVDCVLIKPN